jgi:hypothetical protein
MWVDGAGSEAGRLSNHTQLCVGMDSGDTAVRSI